MKLNHFIRLSLASLLLGCLNAAPAEGTVLLTEQGVKNLGLETVKVEEATFETTTFALGRTELVPENRSLLSSAIPGSVIESRLRLGLQVSKGQELVLIESRHPGNPTPTVWLTAPAEGTVVAVNTTLGAPVEPTDILAEFADLRTLNLIATLPQAVAGRIRQGTQAKIRFPVLPDREYIATMQSANACPCPDPACGLGLAGSLRSEKREGPDLNTTGVLFSLANPDNQLRPGMSAECSIIMERREQVLSVPREALQGSPTSRHVFVRHPAIPNAFDRVSVHAGLVSNGRVEILEGLFPGDEVVTRGSYSLGFAGGGSGPSLKDAMDAAHGHEHNDDGSEKKKGGEASAAADVHDDHDHGSQRPALRELFFMASTAILAVLLLVSSLRRQRATGDNSRKS